jgi:glycolate oxidase
MLYEAIKPFTVEILDVSLPRGELAAHVEKIGEISERFQTWIPTYGHAADGNLHSHVTRSRLVEGRPVPVENWKENYSRIRDAIHEDAMARGGVVSGEHGIGLLKKNYLVGFLGDAQVELMKGIKRAFDPNFIMNPGKIFDP